jgi:hypothetical protein
VTSEEWFLELDARLAPVGGRTAQLFAAACCRRAWPAMTDPRHRAVVGAAEAFADGELTPSEFAAVMNPVVVLWANLPDARRVEWDAWHYLTGATRHLGVREEAAHAASYAARGLARLAGVDGSEEWQRVLDEEGAAQRELLDDLAGLPDRSVSLDPSWRTTAAAGLAARMYDGRDFALMPVLADALEDAGCTDEDVLTHCRDDGLHARGCWVVDAVLGKG